MKKAFVLIAIAALMVCIIPMADSSDAAGTRGTVTGQITGNTQELMVLNNVNVTLYDTETGDTLVITSTDNKGNYSLEYEEGSYSIRYELKGYDTVISDVTITADTSVTKNISMRQNESYFGMDLPHVLMIIGGSLAVVLLIFTLIVRMRLSKR